MTRCVQCSGISTSHWLEAHKGICEYCWTSDITEERNYLIGIVAIIIAAATIWVLGGGRF